MARGSSDGLSGLQAQISMRGATYRFLGSPADYRIEFPSHNVRDAMSAFGKIRKPGKGRPGRKAECRPWAGSGMAALECATADNCH